MSDESCHRGFIHEIAECSGVPRAYLAKILKRLNDADLVKSKRGHKGGIWLTRPATEITIWDISKAVDGDEFISRCLLGDEFCDDSRDCPTHAFWKVERTKIHDELVRTTLANVVAFNKKRKRSRKARC